MPKHFMYGLYLFFALAASGSAYAQKVAVPLPENGQLGDTGVQTLLYVVPNDVEVRVERHWTDNRLQFRMALLQRLLNEDDQRLNLQILRHWAHGRLQLDMQQSDNSLRSEVRFETQVGNNVRMGAMLWQDRCFVSGTRKRGVEWRSQVKVGEYTQVGLRMTDTRGGCQNGCASVNVNIPL